MRGEDPFNEENCLVDGMADIKEYKSLHVIAFQLLKKIFKKTYTNFNRGKNILMSTCL